MINDTADIYMTDTQGCCMFCGKQAFDYRTACVEPLISGQQCKPELKYCKRFTERLEHPSSSVSVVKSSNVWCYTCISVMNLLEMFRDSGFDLITSEIGHYCKYLLIFKHECITILQKTIINSLLAKLNHFHAPQLCRQMFNVCLAENELHLSDTPFHRMRHLHLHELMAPRQRFSVLHEHEGDVMPPGSLAAIDKLTYDMLVRNFLGEDGPGGYEQTMKWLARYGLIANALNCPQCDHRASLVKYGNNPEGFTWRCSHCRKAVPGAESSSRFSIRFGSFFSQVHLSLHQILKIGYFWSVHPYSTIDAVMRETEVLSRDVIIDYYNFFRDLTQAWALRMETDEKLGGIGAVVEIDETKMYRAKYHRGRMLNRAYEWVFGLLERGTNKVRFFPVADRSAATLLPIIAENVEDGTTIISDGWAAYGGINNMQQQYNHQWVNHQLYFVDPLNPQIHTQGIEATWRALKQGLKHLHGTTPELLPTYLFQYAFRRYHSNEKIFQHVLEEMRRSYPV